MLTKLRRGRAPCRCREPEMLWLVSVWRIQGWVWAVIAMWWLAVAPAFAQESRRPRPANIILILADDLGYGDLGCYGQQQIRTPHLDRLAAEGMRFTQFYAGSTVCAPSRCVLMTGLHTGHCYIRGNARYNLRPEDRTLAEVLKSAGYATAHIGKWGLGHENSTGVPTRKGFDYFFGYLDQVHAHNYYPTFLLRNGTRVRLPNVVPKEGPNGEGVASERRAYSHDLFTEEALRWIGQHRDQPFFLYLAYTIPHANNEAQNAKYTVATSRKRLHGMEVPDLGIYKDRPWPESEKAFAAMVTRLDADIGRIVARVRELGLERETLILFSSDNGPHGEGGHDPKFFQSSGNLRGMKRDLYEGGIRVPLIAWWPGRIPAGKVSAQVGWFADVLPTLADLAGAKPPEGLDGVSLVPTLLGKEREQRPPRYLYWEFYERGGAQAVRWGKWKGVCKPFWGRLELYDLESDPGESGDLAEQHPDVVAKLQALLKEAHEPSPLWPIPKPVQTKLRRGQ
ncbi:Arylsulfatase [bacterium HR36]|nr:Arylsulfatase [bacterium HR36]